MKGQIYITTEIDQESTVLTSEDLIIFLDAENATFKYVLDPSTLLAKDSSLLSEIKKLDESIVIEGRFDINRIPHGVHAPIRTNFEGTTNSLASNKIVKGDVLIRYTQTQWFNSLLNLKMIIDAGDLGLADDLDFSSELIEISIKHPIIHEGI